MRFGKANVLLQAVFKIISLDVEGKKTKYLMIGFKLNLLPQIHSNVSTLNNQLKIFITQYAF